MAKQVKDKRTAIMDAALKLFTERGFHGTSTALISKEAGVSTGSLFNYFATKEELINNLYFEVKSRLSACLKKGLDNGSSSEDQIKQLWSAFIRCGVNKPEEFLFVAQFSASPYITKLTREETMKEYEFMHALVEEIFGKDKDYSMDLSMSIFYHSSRAVVELILNSNSQSDMDKIIEDGFQMIWRGMAPE